MRKLLCIAILLPFLCSLHPRYAESGQDTLTLSRATQKLSKEYKRLHPIATYLAEQLKQDGIKQGKVTPLGSNQKVIDYLAAGKIDIVLETPYSAALYFKSGTAYPILLISRKGVAEYNSFIFCRKDQPVKSLADLKGKVIAFEDPTSTSAYFLPRLAFKNNGIELIQMADLTMPVPHGKVGYTFADSEINVSSWVYFKKVAAGALSCLDWKEQEENPQAFKSSFKIIHQTDNVPRMVVMVRQDLNPMLVAQIKTLLFDMHQSEKGRAALKPYKIDGFFDLPQSWPKLFQKLASL